MQRTCLPLACLLRVVASITLAAASVSISLPAHAAPDTVPDPLMQLLGKRAVMSTPTERPLAQTDSSHSPPLAEAATDLLNRLQARASELVITAMNFVGVRYKRGGTSAETGFDCSGFTRHIYEVSIGLALPRSAEEQATAPGFVAVARSALQPGDLVFFHTLKHAFSHVGIYVGNNRFIHSPSTGGLVRTEDMGFAYWKNRFDGARRPEGVALISASSTPPSAEPVARTASGIEAPPDAH